MTSYRCGTHGYIGKPLEIEKSVRVVSQLEVYGVRWKMPGERMPGSLRGGNERMKTEGKNSLHSSFLQLAARSLNQPPVVCGE